MNSYYQRQIILPFVGQQGQKKLISAKILIVGAGGLGHPAALYLAGAGIGKLGILDFDQIDYSNLHRQIVFSPEDVNKNKAEILASKISKQNPFIQTISHTDFLDKYNIEHIFEGYDIVLDCCDNLETKFLIHDHCYKMNKVLVQGSIDQLEGDLKVFDFRLKRDCICLRCLWENVPQQNCIGTCSEEGVLPTTAGVFGLLMANEVIKIILEEDPLKNGESFIFNLRSLGSRKLKWSKNLNCPLCSEVASENEVHYSFELSPNQIDDIKDFKIIEIYNSNLPASEINPNIKYLLICEQGVESLRRTKILREEGYQNVWSLSGGRKSLKYFKS